MTREEKPFLDRWSRRKHAARRGEPLPEPAQQPSNTESAPREQARPASPAPENGKPPATAQSSNAPAELPSVDSLQGLASDYKAFLRSDVDTATRSAALKKLFFDPHFNQMDGLDVYIDDYSKFEPLPASMLRQLSHARHLLNFEKEETAEQGAQSGEPAPDTPQPAQDAESSTAALPESTPADPLLKTAGDTSSAPASQEPTPKQGDA